MQSPPFSSFRQILDLWDEHVDREKVEQTVRAMLDNEGFTLFIKAEKELFGVKEDGRVVFARMKSPDEDKGDWMKQAMFTAVNISKSMQGKGVSVMFGKHDLKHLKVVEKEKAIEELVNNGVDSEAKIPESFTDNGKPDNFIQATET